MAYDPFRAPGGSYNNNNGQGYRYGDMGQQGQHAAGGGYDMYDNTYPPHAHMSNSQPYDMDPSMDPSMDQSMDMGPASFRGTGPDAAAKDEFDPFAPPPKSTGDLRMWRQDHRGNLWTKGSRPGCIGRFFCCSLMTVVLLVVSILLTLAIFLRPPDVTFDGLAPIDPNTIQSSSDSLNVTLGLQISVQNPNFFSLELKAIKASLVYPINNTQIGGGEEDNIDFKSNTQTSFTFPFVLGYSEAADPDGNVLKDIAEKCGFVPGSIKSNLEVDYTITIKISILGITVSPPFSGSVSLACPFSLQDMKPLIAAFPALQGLIPS